MLVPPEQEMAMLHALGVERLWGVGPVTARRLRERGIERVGQIAALGEEELVAALGRAGGRHLHALAHNRDPRPVRSGRRRRTFGAQSALGRRSRSDEESAQLELPVGEAAPGADLDAALDAVRDRFGPAALTRALLIGRDPGLAAFLSPRPGGRRGGGRR